MKKNNIIQLIVILVLIIILGVIVKIVVDAINENNKPQTSINKGMQQESTEKQTNANDVDKGNEVKSKTINLNEYSSNITITEAGEYTITGSFNYSILIDCSSEVIINLNGIEAKNTTTAAIANIGTGILTINIKEGTINTLSDGGSSEYDGCIYSNGALIIEGNGTLYVYGNQEEGEGIATQTNDITINGGNIYIECNDDGINAGGDGGTITINDGNIYIKANGDGIDSNQNLIINGGSIYTMGSSTGGDAGIDTDEGFEINGGTVVAIGSDMLETPEKTSSQYTICFKLDSKITSGTLVTLLNKDDEIIISFEAREDFKTLIISSDKLEKETYYLYQNGNNTGSIQNGIYYDGKYTKGNKICASSNNEFNITSVVTVVGK